MNNTANSAIGDIKQKVHKKLKYRSENFSIGKLCLVEVLTMFFALGPAAATWFTTIAFLRVIWENPYFYLWLLLLPSVVIFSFLLITLMMRLSLPKVKAGVFPIGISKGFLAWLLTLYLGHGVRIAGLQPLFSAFYGLKYLYWKAMGANIAYGINSSIFTNFADYPMLTIKSGCSIGAFSLISCHTFVGNKVLVGPVTIEKNVYVGLDVIIGPRTTIGEGAWIGAGNRLLQDTVAPNAKVENFEWEHFSPKIKNNDQTLNSKPPIS